MAKSYTVELIEDPDNPDDLILPLSEELCEELGWTVGDDLTWEVNKYGTITLSKKGES